MKTLCDALNIPFPEPVTVGPVPLHLNALTVTDPCYEKGIWCAMELPVKPGNWLAYSHRIFHTWMESHFKKAYEEEQAYIAKRDALIQQYPEFDGDDKDLALMVIRSKNGLEFQPWMFQPHSMSREYKDFKKGIFPYQTTAVWITHESVDTPMILEDVGMIGVDSGQAGFFDTVEFAKVSSGTPGFDEFYARCCGISHTGTLDVGIGVNVDSGDGDGSYTVMVGKRDDEIVAVKIVFMEV